MTTSSAPTRVATFVAVIVLCFAAAFLAGRAVGAPEAPPATMVPGHVGSGDGR